MDLLNTEDLGKKKITAQIKYFGYNNRYFGTKKAGSLIGEEVEIVHLYPVSCKRKTNLGYDHAIVILPHMDVSILLKDVKFENIKVE